MHMILLYHMSGLSVGDVALGDVVVLLLVL